MVVKFLYRVLKKKKRWKNFVPEKAMINKKILHQ